MEVFIRKVYLKGHGEAEVNNTKLLHFLRAYSKTLKEQVHTQIISKAHYYSII